MRARCAHFCYVRPYSVPSHKFVLTRSWRPCRSILLSSLLCPVHSGIRLLYGADACRDARVNRTHLEAMRESSRANYKCVASLPLSASRHVARVHRALPIVAFFLGGVPTLKHREVISSSTDRFRLHTETSGEVSVRLSIIPKDLAKKRIGVRTDLHGGEGGMLKGCYWEVAIWSSAHGISGIDGRNLLLPLSLK
eukprot:scaffold82792_cov33-Tisochrysis_lutea.AAC.2